MSAPDMLTIVVESVTAAMTKHNLDVNPHLVSGADVYVNGTGNAAAKAGIAPEWFTTVGLDLEFLPSSGAGWPLSQPAEAPA